MQPSIEWLEELKGADLDDICTATEEAIRDGLGFDWVRPPVRETLEAYWRGVLLVPVRELIVGRADGTIAGGMIPKLEESFGRSIKDGPVMTTLVPT